MVKLARKNGSSDADEAAVLREVAEILAGACKPDRWELWFLGEDRTRWSLDHVNYTSPRRESKAARDLSLRQTGPYLRALEQVWVKVSSDLKKDPNAHTLVGHGSIEPHGASRLDIPIRVEGKVVAVLVVVQNTGRPWTPGEGRFAASIGDRMSLLLQAARAGEAPNGQVDQRPAMLAPAASSAVDGFIHLNEKLRFTFLNPAALRWLDERGVDGSTLIGRGLEESMRGVEDRSIVAEVRKANRGGGPARLRRQLERGGPWLDVDVNPSAAGVSVTIQNRARGRERQAERSLRESETRFRSVVESLREGLIITDLDDRIVYVNSRIIDLTGHRPEDLDGKLAQRLLFDTSNWPDGDQRMTARREKKRTRYNAPLVHKKGTVLPVEVISTPLRDADGTVTGVVDAITAMGNYGELRSEEVGGSGSEP